MAVAKTIAAVNNRIQNAARTQRYASMDAPYMSSATQLVFGARIENQSKNVNTGYPNIDSLANIPEGTGLQTSAETMIMQYATSRTVFVTRAPQLIWQLLRARRSQ